MMLRLPLIPQQRWSFITSQHGPGSIQRRREEESVLERKERKREKREREKREKERRSCLSIIPDQTTPEQTTPARTRVFLKSGYTSGRVLGPTISCHISSTAVESDSFCFLRTDEQLSPEQEMHVLLHMYRFYC
jgi:hypothetical protein